MQHARTFRIRRIISIAGACVLPVVVSSCTSHQQKSAVPVLGGKDSLSPERFRTAAGVPSLQGSASAARLEHFLRQRFGDVTESSSRYTDRYGLTLSGNGQHLLVSTYNSDDMAGRAPKSSTSQVIDLQTLRTSPQLPPSDAEAISYDGRYVAQSATNADVSISDVQHPDRDLATIFLPPDDPEFIYQMAFSRDNERLLIHRANYLYVYDISAIHSALPNPTGTFRRDDGKLVQSISVIDSGMPADTVGFGADNRTIIGAGFGIVGSLAPTSAQPRVVSCHCVKAGPSSAQIAPDGKTIQFTQGNVASVWDIGKKRERGLLQSRSKIQDADLINLPGGLIANFEYPDEATSPATLEIFRTNGTFIAREPIRNELLGGHVDKRYDVHTAYYTSGGLVILVVIQDTRNESGPPAAFRVLELR